MKIKKKQHHSASLRHSVILNTLKHITPAVTMAPTVILNKVQRTLIQDLCTLKHIMPAVTMALVLLLTGCTKKSTPAYQSKMCMDTVCTINLFDQGTEKLYEKIFDRLDNLEQQFSATIDSSTISKINRNAGIKPVDVSDEVFYLLETSLKISELTQGAFDITSGPLIDLWNINGKNPSVPPKEKIHTAMELCDYKKLHLTEQPQKTAFLEKKGMKINLGAVVKGYAADTICTLLENEKIQKAVIDLGGNIYVFGKKENGKPWTIGIKNPKQPEGSPLLKVTSEQTSVVTSGVYERYFIQDNVRYHHIFDTKTGYPAQTGLESTTVICSSSLAADILSTTCFVLGETASVNMRQEFENVFGTDITFVFIDGDGTVTQSGTAKVTDCQ